MLEFSGCDLELWINHVKIHRDFCEGYPSISNHEGTSSCLPTLWTNVLVGSKSEETSKNGMWIGDMRDSFCLSILSIQIENTSQFLQASTFSSQYQKVVKWVR